MSPTMFADDVVLLSTVLFLAAALYAAVGHGGASAYLSVLALSGQEPTVMRPTVLAMNVVVASIASFAFHRAGAFSLRLFVPLALASVPMAYLGGRLRLPTEEYELVIGAVLAFAALRFLVTAKDAGDVVLQTPSAPVSVAVGGALGFSSGLIGVGGGIFLSPLLLLLRWASVKVVAGVSAAFIVANSCAGLAGSISSGGRLHPALPLWIVAVVVGGALGAKYGSRRLGGPTLQRLLALVLGLAATKMYLA